MHHVHVKGFAALRGAAWLLRLVAAGLGRSEERAPKPEAEPVPELCVGEYGMFLLAKFGDPGAVANASSTAQASACMHIMSHGVQELEVGDGEAGPI